MRANTRYQFVLVYTIAARAKAQAVMDVQAAVAAGALHVGADSGLPLHRFPLEQTADAQAAVEAHVVGKVLIDVTAPVDRTRAPVRRRTHGSRPHAPRSARTLPR